MIFIPCYHPRIATRSKGLTCRPHLEKSVKTDSEEYFKLICNNDLNDTWLVPCGECVGCRLDYAKEWANRCYLESLTKSPNWFVTLTYDDAHLPEKISFKDDNTCFIVNSLEKEVVSSFVKRLRSYFDYHGVDCDLSYYYCGEYGSQYGRPHYHVLLFGVPFDDLKVHCVKDGFVTYNSELLNSLWRNGFVTVNEFAYETASYVARYMLKKQKGFDSIVYNELDIVPEFVNMSRNPGIGYNFYVNNRDDIFEKGYISVKNSKGIQHERIPRYFERLLEKEDPERFLKMKKERQLKFYDEYQNRLAAKDSVLSNYNQRLIDENTKLSQIKALRRQFESKYNCL